MKVEIAFTSLDTRSSGFFVIQGDCGVLAKASDESSTKKAQDGMYLALNALTHAKVRAEFDNDGNIKSMEIIRT